jgi:hypothetical protein
LSSIKLFPESRDGALVHVSDIAHLLLGFLAGSPEEEGEQQQSGNSVGVKFGTAFYL